MASNVYKISVRRGPEEGQSFPLSSDSVTVGRDPMVEVVFSDPEVSRQHARFTKVDEGYQLQDLGSTNGTFVDGKRLGGEIVSLQPGAVITMGSNVTVVYEAAPDPMATVISPDLDLDFMEEDEPRASVGDTDELRTMMETPEPDDDVFPGFDEALDEVDEALDYDSGSTALEYPAASEPQQFAAEDDDAFSFDFDDVDYGEPLSPAAGVGGDERTVLDMEASDLSSYGSQSAEDDSLPSFGESSDLPSFDDEPAYTPSPAMKAGSQSPPPPPPPAPVKEADPNKRRNMIIAVVVLLLLCCCCSIAVSYFYLGDIILEYMQF